MTAEKKREITGWVSLFTLIVMFSGLLKNHPTLRALDFSYLLGTFGKISEGADFAGKGGIGTRQGFLVALTLVPITDAFFWIDCSGTGARSTGSSS